MKKNLKSHGQKLLYLEGVKYNAPIIILLLFMFFIYLLSGSFEQDVDWEINDEKYIFDWVFFIQQN